VSRHSTRLIGPGLLIAALLLARLAAVPALSELPSHTAALSSLHLSVPPLYLLLGPLFSLWDGMSMLSMTRLTGFLQGLAGLYVLWRVLAWRRRSNRVSSPLRAGWLREVGTLLVSLVCLLLYLVIGLLWHRPMLSLAGVPPGFSVVDFHSHTNLSHDVRGTLMRGFDAEANRRWHARAGFDAVFITDHNTPTLAPYRPGHPTLCHGNEVSASGAHIVLLGDTLPISGREYRNGLPGLLRLLSVSDTAVGALSVASLPEYRRNHWDHLAELIAAGLDGFEVVNAAPKANQLVRAERDSVIALARAHNRFVVGVSDIHGWGATSLVWNLVQVPPQSPQLCANILGRLRLGFPAVQIIERHRLRPDDAWPLWLTPVGVLWETWRSMDWRLTLSWIVWITLWACWRSRGALPLLRDHRGTNIAPE
jgi:hypothetical protein